MLVAEYLKKNCADSEYPADPISIIEAERFMKALPAKAVMTISPLELNIDPDGEISFEWYSAPRYVFTVSVGVKGRLTFAGLFDEVTVKGIEYFNDEIPEVLIMYIEKIIKYDAEHKGVNRE